MSLFFIVCVKYHHAHRTLKREELLILPLCRLTHFSLMFEELRAIKLTVFTTLSVKM